MIRPLTDNRWAEQLRVVAGLRARIKSGALEAVWIDLTGRPLVEIALPAPDDPRERIHISWPQAVRLADGESVESVLAVRAVAPVEKQTDPRWAARREEYLARKAA